MSDPFGRAGLQDASLQEIAVALMSQQIWCWGKDILRPEGNWLIENGFERHQPPDARETCPSVYTRTMPNGRTVALRGYGVFYGDRKQGCIFLPRYDFEPLYTPFKTLRGPLWSLEDLPKLKPPKNAKREVCGLMLKELIGWFGDYESDIAQRLGVAYRRSTLSDWDDGKKRVIPVEDFAPAWRKLAIEMAASR